MDPGNVVITKSKSIAQGKSIHQINYDYSLFHRRNRRKKCKQMKWMKKHDEKENLIKEESVLIVDYTKPVKLDRSIILNSKVSSPFKFSSNVILESQLSSQRKSDLTPSILRPLTPLKIKSQVSNVLIHNGVASGTNLSKKVPGTLNLSLSSSTLDNFVISPNDSLIDNLREIEEGEFVQHLVETPTNFGLEKPHIAISNIEKNIGDVDTNTGTDVDNFVVSLRGEIVEDMSLPLSPTPLLVALVETPTPTLVETPMLVKTPKTFYQEISCIDIDTDAGTFSAETSSNFDREASHLDSVVNVNETNVNLEMESNVDDMSIIDETVIMTSVNGWTSFTSAGVALKFCEIKDTEDEEVVEEVDEDVLFLQIPPIVSSELPSLALTQSLLEVFDGSTVLSTSESSPFDIPNLPLNTLDESVMLSPSSSLNKSLYNTRSSNRTKSYIAKSFITKSPIKSSNLKSGTKSRVTPYINRRRNKTAEDNVIGDDILKKRNLNTTFSKTNKTKNSTKKKSKGLLFKRRTNTKNDKKKIFIEKVKHHNPPYSKENKNKMWRYFNGCWTECPDDTCVQFGNGRGGVIRISTFYSQETYNRIRQEDRDSEWTQEVVGDKGAYVPTRHLSSFKARGVSATAHPKPPKKRKVSSTAPRPGGFLAASHLSNSLVTEGVIDQINSDFSGFFQSLSTEEVQKFQQFAHLNKPLNSDETVVYVTHPEESCWDTFTPHKTAPNQQHMNFHHDGECTEGFIAVGCIGASGVVYMGFDKSKNPDSPYVDELFYIPTEDNTGYIFYGDWDEDYAHGRILNQLFYNKALTAHVYRHLISWENNANIDDEATPKGYVVKFDLDNPSNSNHHSGTKFFPNSVPLALTDKELLDINRELIFQNDPSLAYWVPGDCFKNKTILRVVSLFPSTMKGIAGKQQAVAIYWGAKGYDNTLIYDEKSKKVTIHYATPQHRSSESSIGGDAKQLECSMKNKLRIRVFLSNKCEHRKLFPKDKNLILYLMDAKIKGMDYRNNCWYFKLVGELDY